jgi:hypothetical protein
VLVQNHRLELRGTNYTVRSYVSIENTGDSYNVKPMADNLDLASGGTNGQWGGRFKTVLQNELNAGADLATAMGRAREVADQGRVEPGTPEFDNLKNTIRSINNWDIGSVIAGAPETGGAWLRQQSRMYHADGQYDFATKSSL